MKLNTLAMIAAVFLSNPADSRWGPGGCTVAAPVGVTRVPLTLNYVWEPRPNIADQIDLLANGEIIGSYFFSTGKYHGWTGYAWENSSTPPIAPPGVPFATFQGDGEIFFGLDEAHRSKRERHLVNGREVTAADALGALFGSGLEDDSKKKHLTAIGSDAASKARFDAFLASPAIADIVQTCRVQSYDASRPIDKAMLEVFRLDADPKFTTSGGVLVLQDPEKDGRGKGQIIGYGAQDNAALAGALRKADPSWNAPTPLPGPNSPTQSIPPAVWLTAGVVALFAVSRRKV